MRRECAGCHQYMGEKCPHCGSMTLSMAGGDIGHPLYKCAPEGHIFERGEGGVTHGMCLGCIAKQKSDLDAARLRSAAAGANARPA